MNLIELFFQEPSASINPPNNVSNLYLLRRDIRACYGFDPNTNLKMENQIIAIWPGVMAIMAGIDLLSKFYSGEDSNNKSRERFLTYVSKYIDNRNQEVLYQLRNSLLHSFGLYSESFSGNIYKFNLGINYQSELVIVKKPYYLIDVNELRIKFEYSIELFKTEYSKLESFKKFILISEKYGWTRIRNINKMWNVYYKVLIIFVVKKINLNYATAVGKNPAELENVFATPKKIIENFWSISQIPS